jgi:septum formation protein
LTDREISAYVESGSPLDKAGAYGIQDDFGAMFVHRVEGCYYTIVGLPLELLYTELRSLVAEVA